LDYSVFCARVDRFRINIDPKYKNTTPIAVPNDNDIIINADIG